MDFETVLFRKPADSLPAELISGKKTKTESHRTIDVYCRFRPVSSEDKISQYYQIDTTRETVELDAPDEVLKKNQGIKRYLFTKVFDEQSTQEVVYEAAIRDMIDLLVSQERNGLIFSYGVTNAGKTHTIIGSKNNLGVLPRLLKELIELKENAQEGRTPKGVILGENCKIIDIDVGFECFEIYNEEVFDLQVEFKRGERNKPAERPKLKIRDFNKKMIIEDLTLTNLKNLQEADDNLARCLKNRQVANTLLNSNSSRSHTVFRLGLSMHLESLDSSSQVSKTFGYICIVDLAGSERAKRTENADGKLKEACGINNSLLVLGRCLNALRKDLVVPFRDCKLTKFLAEFFLYNSTIKMITNINPREEDFLESLRVLNYSSLAKEVKLIMSELRANRVDSAAKPKKSVFTDVIAESSSALEKASTREVSSVDGARARYGDDGMSSRIDQMSDNVKQILLKLGAIEQCLQFLERKQSHEQFNTMNSSVRGCQKTL